MLRSLLNAGPQRLAACGAIAIGSGSLVAPAALCESRVLASPAEPAPTLAQRCLAEAIGTGSTRPGSQAHDLWMALILIVQVGCGVVCAAKYAGSTVTPFGIAVTWGMGVALAVYSTRAVSGAHLNPAVSTALAVHGDFPAAELPAYVAAQMLGATIAGAVNYATFAAGIAEMEAAQGIVRGAAASTASFAGAFGMVPNTALVGSAGAFVAEAWMTAVFLFLVSAIGDASKESVPAAAAPVLVGTSVAALICTFGPVTGCGMNPARDLGPRLITLLTGWGGAATTSWWVYTLGPLTGGVLGIAAYKALLQETPKAT